MSAALLTWLAKPASFAAGVVLYEQLGGSTVYKQLFALGETSYSRQVLVQQLQALASGPTPVPVPTTPAAPTSKAAPVVASGAVEPTQTHTASPLLGPLRDQLRLLRDERSLLHAQLSAPRLSRTDRRKRALRICVLTDQVGQLLLSEAHVLEHGRLPGPVATVDVTDTGELRRRLDNLISLRAKVRKRPERAAELPALEDDIQLIRLKLDIS